MSDLLLWLSIAVPVGAVLSWFFFRLFEGRHVDEWSVWGDPDPPSPPLEPALGPDHVVVDPADRPGSGVPGEPNGGMPPSGP